MTIERTRKGRFSIPYTWIDNNEHDLILAVLKGCIILKAEFCAERDVIDYWAFHADFPPIADGVDYPKYFVRFTIRDKDPYREVGMDQTHDVERVFIGWKDSIAQGADMAGRECRIGLDLSARTDLTALALVVDDGMTDDGRRIRAILHTPCTD